MSIALSRALCLDFEDMTLGQLDTFLKEFFKDKSAEALEMKAKLVEPGFYTLDVAKPSSDEVQFVVGGSLGVIIPDLDQPGSYAFFRTQ
jgi:hypothetical protein